MLRFDAACTETLPDFPAGALLAITEDNSIVYSPAFAASCHAFSYGSLGYIQMCAECLRMLVYLVIGYVLPALCQQSQQYISKATLEAWPHSKALAPSPEPGKRAGPVGLGHDPGLWVCRQCFRTSWARMCLLEPGAHAAAQPSEACLRCTTSAPLRGTHTERALCAPIAGASDSSDDAQPHAAALTSAAASVLLVQRLPRPPHTAEPPAVILHREAVRSGATLHDEPSAQQRQELAAHLQDHLAPQPGQVAALGSFESCAQHGAPQDTTPRLFADLRSQRWGACVDARAAKEELAQRQGACALVPGPLGPAAAFFYVPAFAHDQALLQRGLAALHDCRRLRLWAGYHESAR